MPVRIPGPADVSTPRPARDPGVTARPDDFGAQVGRAQQERGQAIADAGRAFERIGQVAQELLEQRQQAEDQVFLDTFNLEFQKQARSDFETARTEMPEDGSGFAQTVDQRLSGAQEQVIEDLRGRGFAPSDDAIQEAQSRGMQVRTRYGVTAVTEAHNQRIFQLEGQLDQNFASIQAEVLQTGDLDGALERIDETAQSARGIIPPDDLENKRMAAREATVDAHVTALERRGEARKARETVERFYGADPRPRVTGEASDSYAGKVAQVESGGDPQARAATSSATGLFQFTDSTWLAVARRHEPGLFEGRSREEVLALRTNPAISRRMFDHFTNDNRQKLEEAGLPVTDGTLYLAHFAGVGGAKKLLRASPNTPVGAVLGQAAVNANPFLEGKSASDVVAWAARKVGDAAPVRVASVSDVTPEMPDAGKALRWHSNLDGADKARRQEYLSAVEDYEAFLRAGNEPTDQFTWEDLSSNLPVDEAIEAQEALERAEEFGQKVAQVKFATPAEIERLERQSRARLDDPENFQRNADEYRQIVKAIEDRNKQLVESPAEFVRQNETIDQAFNNMTEAFQGDDPEAMQRAASRYIRRSLAEQERLGLPREARRVLPPGMVDDLARRFRRTEEGGQNAHQLMLSLREQFGDEHWPRIFNEIGGEIPGLARVVGSMDRPDQRRAAERLSELAVAGEQSLKEALPSTDVSDVQQEVLDVMAPFTDTLHGLPNWQSENSVYQNAVRLLAMDYMVGGESARSASQAAFDDVLGKKYEFRGSMRIPHDQDARQIEAGARRALTQLDDADIAPPDMVFMEGLREEDVRADHIRSLEQFGEWRTLPDDSGLFLLGPDGAAVTRQDGEIFSVEWDELSQIEPRGEMGRVEPELQEDIRRLQEQTTPEAQRGARPEEDSDVVRELRDAQGQVNDARRRLEAGEITQDEFNAIAREQLDRARELREQSE